MSAWLEKEKRGRSVRWYEYPSNSNNNNIKRERKEGELTYNHCQGAVELNSLLGVGREGTDALDHQLADRRRAINVGRHDIQ